MTGIARREGLLAIRAAPPAGPGDYLYAPWLAGLPVAAREVLPLLPVADLNGRMLAALAEAPPLAGRPVAALMLADPFLRVRDVAPLLAQAGLRRIANFPTVQLVDGDAARALESAGLGAAREAATLCAFAAAGFAGVAFARDLAGARLMLAAAPSILVLHPGVALADWRQRAAAATGLLKIVRTLRREASCPLLVYRPHGYGAELDPVLAEADGEAAMEEA